MGTARQGIVIAVTLSIALLWTKAHSETLVYPRLLESRADDGEFLLHVSSGLTLNLRKSSILAKDFVIASSTDTGSDQVILNGSELEQDLYHDTEHRSSLFIRRRQNGVEVRGILNEQLRITPAVLAQRSDDGLIPHEVFTVDERSSTSLNTSENDEKRRCAKENGTKAAATNNSGIADQFVVEVCVLLGSTYWRAFNGTEDLVTYVATTMNAAALSFIEMTDPEISLQLNAIYMHENDSIAGRNICGPTLYELSNNNACALDILDALNATRSLKNSCALRKCDLLVQLTSADLAVNVNDTYINRLVKGVASFGGVCTNRSAVVAEDHPLKYSGVTDMAHEIAHALGASHDGEDQTLNISGYPDALNCSWQDGYLMSPSGEGKNKYRLSNCTKAQIRALVSTLPDSCILVNIKANYSNHFYPGQNVTSEAFCRLMHPQQEDVHASNKSVGDYQQCKMKCCWKPDYGSVQERLAINVDDLEDDYDYDYGGPEECQEHSMLEAMPCGENKTCWRGVCGVHNWTEIYRTYHTDRAFETL